MRITVCVKQVPDTGTDRELRPGDSTVAREATDAVINELDEFAIEEGLRLAEKHGGEVTVLSMGPERALDAIRRALAMGADRGIQVCDEALHGSDALVTSAVLAAALTRAGFDLVVLGAESTDARTGIMAAMLAERLGLPQLSFASRVEADGDRLRIRRLADYGYDLVEASLPAVVSVVEKINEPRYPSFKGIMAAKKKPVEVLTLADIGLTAEQAGLAASATEVTGFQPRPPRQAGTVVVDEGEGGIGAADFLAAGKFS